MLAFEDTGAYRLLLPAMSEDPAELQRFYAETVAPLVAYDDQYETDLVQTLETFLDADGNVAGTAARLYTHRHTVRYRLERVKDLTSLDVASTDGREKLGLGLKAMRVLGIAAPRGPGHRGRAPAAAASSASSRIGRFGATRPSWPRRPSSSFQPMTRDPALPPPGGRAGPSGQPCGAPCVRSSDIPGIDIARPGIDLRDLGIGNSRCTAALPPN